MANNTVAELVFIPTPALGHIMSTIEMAKLLIHRDPRLSINVLLITTPLHNLALATYIHSLTQTPIQRLRFTQIPQPHTPPNLDPEAPMTSFCKFINTHRNSVTRIVSDMINQTSTCYKVAGFVVDIMCIGMIDVANEFNLPTYVFFTSNAAFLGFKLHLDTLCKGQIHQNKDKDKDKDTIDAIHEGDQIVVPSFVNPVPMKVFPALYQVEDGMEFLVYAIGKMRDQVKGIMVNTFLELEPHAIKSFSGTDFPPVYPVGPVVNVDGVAGKADISEVFSWLDGQPRSSVVLLCFGSAGSFGEVQVREIARGLERSGYRFVWSLRQSPPDDQSYEALPNDYDDPRAVLPDGFLERTMGIGKVIGWAPQAALLAHEAVGGFVSHCGWNSMLESLWFGVPTATWPIYCEQQVNAFEMVVELGLAVDLKMDFKINVFNPNGVVVIVTAEEIERGIKQLMEDKDVRSRVKVISEMSRLTVVEGGSSYTSIGYLIQDIISNVL